MNKECICDEIAIAYCHIMHRPMRTKGGRFSQPTIRSNRVAVQTTSHHEQICSEILSRGRYWAGRTFRATPFTSGTIPATRWPFSVLLIQPQRSRRHARVTLKLPLEHGFKIMINSYN